MVRIIQTETSTVVTAPMPESFMFDSAASYEAPYAQGLFGNGALSQLAKLGGLRLTSQALTAQVWQGSNDTQLSVELEFQSETDPLTEVRDPILALLKLATPSVLNDLILSPGPQLDLETLKAAANDVSTTATSLLNNSSTTTNNGANQSSSTTSTSSTSATSNNTWRKKIKNQVTIQIGNYAYFESVVITNVQKTYTSQIDVLTGWPQHARVSVQFKPLFMLVQSDLDNIFKHAR